MTGLVIFVPYNIVFRLNVLQQVADNLFDPDPYLQSGGDMIRVGGLDYTIDPSKELYQRITDARLDKGYPIEADTVAGRPLTGLPRVV